MTSRRTFLKMTAATGAALALGPQEWGWASEGSPFAPLQDDPLLRLPEGYSYTVVARTGTPLPDGPVPFYRPHFPDLNVVFPQPGGKLLLSTSHEVPAEQPLPPPAPGETYDRIAGGAVTSLLLNRDLSIAEGAYNAGGMITNCSGSGTPWGTVLTGEESTQSYEADHGFVWEVDPHKNTKRRLDDCGRFEHETAVVDRKTGFVYLTEDSGTDSLLYRMRPKKRGDLARGGILEAYKAGGRWVPIPDPTGAKGKSPAEQGMARGALEFARLEGGRMRGRWFYFTETQDTSACGKVWRLHGDTGRLDLYAQGRSGGKLCMPDNVAFDAAGNLFVSEDKSEEAAFQQPNRVVFIDRRTGKMAIFAEATERVDETTGSAFSPDGKIFFLNLQRSQNFGLTVAITGAFARPHPQARSLAVTPVEAQPEERRVLGAERFGLDIPGAALAALIGLRRRGRIDELSPVLEDVARDLGAPEPVPHPKIRP
jgi:uncharacterized protein